MNSNEKTPWRTPFAAAYIRGGENYPDINGVVEFVEKPNGVFIIVHVTELPSENESGFFGFHIHEGGNCSGVDFADTGSHYDTFGMPHPRHSGDLPSLLSCGGEAYAAFLTDRFSAGEIIGKTVVIHSHPDDFQTQPLGNSGVRIACGVIRAL